uniref:Endothelial cell-specific chemotaxis regulator n=1 Tax=Bos indicus x Bos taurus TaxID=30522 RepID=A0A4W2EY84_BOBOX
MDPCRGEERGCGARSPSLAFVPRSWRRPRGPSQGHKEPGRRRCAVWALHPQLGCLTEQGPWSQSQSVSFYSLTGSSWRASPHPPPRPSSPSLFSTMDRGCLPVADQADMGSVRETQLRWAILGFLLLQAASETPSQFSTEAMTLSSSTVADHLPSSPGPTWSQSQKHTSGLSADVPSSGRSSDSMSGDTSHNVTSTSPNMSFRTTADSTVPPSPTSETVLTVAAFGVISFIAILVVVVIVLVSVVSLRFKCRKNKESEDPQKPGSSGLSESGSTANGEKESITLISMKNINMNNSKGCPSAEKVHFSPGSFLLLPPPFRLYLLNQKGDTLEGPDSSFPTQP